MSYADRVRAASSPKASLAIIAVALDELSERLARIEAGGEWDSWGDDDDDAGFPVDAVAAAVRTGVGADGLTDHEREQHRLAQLAMANDGARDFELPPPTEEKMEFRRMFERQQLKIALALGEEDAGDVDWTETYAKGGPWWFWQERRDLVMSLPYSTRQMMVADIEADNPYLAHEMSLDILKREAGEPDFENGSGALAVATVSSKSVRG